jgi:predicted phosphodiesterase
MRVAALYDVHGNLPALEAVLAEVETENVVDAVVVGGDVLWGPFQSECLAVLRAHDATFVAGNCERDVLGAVNESSAWCRAQLSADELDFVSGWPATVELEPEGLGSAVFCHATPRSDDEILTRTTPDADVVATLSGIEADVVVCGHTHVQYDRRPAGAPRLVNAGSVGLPYQGAPGAFWAVIGPEIELRRTAYDADAALASLASSGFPSAAEIFGESLHGTASAESATAYFEAKRRGS